MKRYFVFATLLLLSPLAVAQNTTGTWTLYPPQATVNQLSIDQPINADGSSVWSVKATVPVQYDVLAGFGPVQFESLLSAQSTRVYPAYSSLDFGPSPALTFDQITNLTAVYSFTTGNCHGGALRWSVNTDIPYTPPGGSPTHGALFIYYGGYPNFTDCTTVGPLTNQSGLNMIGMSDLRYDTSQIGGTFYDTYTSAKSLLEGHGISSITLALDAGWGGDQIVTLGNVTVNDSTFVPKNGGFTPVCATAPATIQVSQIGASNQLTIDESLASTVPDQGTSFRIVGCKYMYNISGKSLGVGQYQVDAIINGVPAVQAGSGTKFALK